MNNKIIEIQNLHKDYTMAEETVNALRGVNLTINAGEFCCHYGRKRIRKIDVAEYSRAASTSQPRGDYWLDGKKRKISEKKINWRIYENTKLGFCVPVLQSVTKNHGAWKMSNCPLLYNPNISTKVRREKSRTCPGGQSDWQDRMKTPLQSNVRRVSSSEVAIARSLVNDPVIILAGRSNR